MAHFGLISCDAQAMLCTHAAGELVGIDVMLCQSSATRQAQQGLAHLLSNSRT